VRAVVDGPGEDSSGEHVGKGHRPREFADQRRPQWATVSQLENTGAASTPSKDFRLLIEVHSSSGLRRGDTTQLPVPPGLAQAPVDRDGRYAHGSGRTAAL